MIYHTSNTTKFFRETVVVRAPTTSSYYILAATTITLTWSSDIVKLAKISLSVKVNEERRHIVVFVDKINFGFLTKIKNFTWNHNINITTCDYRDFFCGGDIILKKSAKMNSSPNPLSTVYATKRRRRSNKR